MAEQMTIPSTSRVVSIDRFRGLIVFCMMFFIAAADFPCLGIFARIANNSTTGRIMLFKGMSLADLADPIFLFLISLSYRGSFLRRSQKSGKRAYVHFLMRYLCFMGVGSIIVSAEYLLVGNGKDPYFIQTLLMFLVAVLFVVYAVLKPIKRVSGKAKDGVKTAMVAALVLMGLIGIVLGIRDDILIFIQHNNENLYKHWSILHEIGMTGLLVLPFIHLNLKGRIVSWFAVGICYTLLQMLPGVIEMFDVVVLGGLLGTVGWFLLMFGGTILMEFYQRETNHKSYSFALLVLGVLAAVTCVFLPMNTSAVTVNYVLFALFAAAVLFGLINLLNAWDPKVKYLVWWGRNPMPLFLIGLVLRVIQKMWHPAADTPLTIALLFTLGGMAFLSAIAWYLYKKDIILRF